MIVAVVLTFIAMMKNVDDDPCDDGHHGDP